VRAWEVCRADVMTTRHMAPYRLRSGCRNCFYARGSSTTAGRTGPESTNCGTNHRSQWRGCSWPYGAAFDAMLATLDRRKRLDEAITAMAADSIFTTVVTRSGGLRGVSTLLCTCQGTRTSEVWPRER
jgi:transposase